jgi:GT2 family glycosyltransferase/glycosyltransferase involved in cell wall biosynthesis
MPSVLFVSYSGLFGGAERVLLEAATAMDGTAVLACPEGPLTQAAGRAGLTAIHLPSRSLRARGGIGRRLSAVSALAAHALELRRLVRDLDPDLIVSWGMRSGLAALALPRATRFAFAHHDFLPSPGVAWLVRRVARRASLVTVPSVAVQNDLDPSAQISARIRVIAPGVDPAQFAGLEAPPGRPHLLLLGALAPFKQPALALEITALARRALPGLTLSVVGDPITADEPLWGELRRRARQPDLTGAVELAGGAPDPRRELERAACLLHCAPAEPFGIVILEALASARPVVVPDAGGPREIVDATCAEFYAPGDAQAGADAVVRLLSDPDRARRMGAAGQSRVRSAFTSARTREGFRDALAPLRRASGSRAAGPGHLTVLTVTFNSAAELAGLIASRDAHLPGTPMIVVDCASTDTSVAVARAGANIQIIALEANVGFGTACNRGLAEVQSPAVALLNPDVELIDDSMLELVGELLRPDRPVRLLSPLVLNLDGTRQDTAHPGPTSVADLVRTLVSPALVPTAWLAPWRSRRPRRIGWAVGAALVARTATLRDLGPFDESIFMYGEDMDLGLKAAAAGIPTWFWPSARVLHAGAHSARRTFGGEAFSLLAQARHETVVRQLGPGRARIDHLAQTVTFISRIAVKTALGRSAQRERRQLAALRSLKRS